MSVNSDVVKVICVEILKGKTFGSSVFSFLCLSFKDSWFRSVSTERVGSGKPNNRAVKMHTPTQSKQRSNTVNKKYKKTKQSRTSLAKRKRKQIAINTTQYKNQ